MPSSPRLALPYLEPSQAQKHVTHNEALGRLDALVHLTVAGFAQAAPPAAPAAGQVWEVGPAPTGAFAGQAGRLAFWDGAGWQFLDPRAGWIAWDATAAILRAYDGAAWVSPPAPLQNLAGVGIGTTSDATNRLAVAADATLLSHAGAGHQIKVNKAGAAQTASLLFQSAFSGFAEMGLAGTNDFAVKVWDGATWRTALSTDRTNGRVAMPQGAVVNGPLSGTAVQATPSDATAGRLLAVGAYGLGGPLPTAGDIGVTDGSLVPGLWSYDSGAGSTNGPAGVTRGTLLHSRRGSGAGAGETQLLLVEAASGAGLVPGLLLGRARSGGAWGGWSCGSVVESGSNANGRWVRHQDGTQTCWATVTTLTTGDLAWTFPQPFVNTTGLVVTMGVASGTGALSPRSATKAAASVGLSALNTAGTRVAVSLDVIAQGRWL